jgi:DNA-binding transcriptional ArsR family regulator
LTRLAIRSIFNRMVEYSAGPGKLDLVFAAVSDPTRRAILAQLRRKPSTVTELARPFPVSLNAVSKHVMVLERAGLIRREIRGREHHCALVAKPLQEATEWLQHYRRFWEVRLDALEEFIVSKKKAKPTSGRKKHARNAIGRRKQD